MNKEADPSPREEADPPNLANAQSPVPLPPEVQRLQTSQPNTYRAVQQYILEVSSHSGPLPSPQQLEAYERASPGTALKIIEMAQAEQATRHHCMRSEVDGLKRGQLCAISAFITAMGATCYLGYLGAFAAAGTVGGTAITVFGGAFILARHFSAKQEQEERPKPPPPKKPKGKKGG